LNTPINARDQQKTTYQKGIDNSSNNKKNWYLDGIIKREIPENQKNLEIDRSYNKIEE